MEPTSTARGEESLVGGLVQEFKQPQQFQLHEPEPQPEEVCSTAEYRKIIDGFFKAWEKAWDANAVCPPWKRARRCNNEVIE